MYNTRIPSVAYPGFLDQWANFSCVEKKQRAKWARFLLVGEKFFGPTMSEMVRRG